MKEGIVVALETSDDDDYDDRAEVEHQPDGSYEEGGEMIIDENASNIDDEVGAGDAAGLASPDAQDYWEARIKSEFLGGLKSGNVGHSQNSDPDKHGQLESPVCKAR